MEGDTQANGAAACFSDPRGGTSEMGEIIGGHSLAACKSIELSVDGRPRYPNEVWNAGHSQEGGVNVSVEAAGPSARAEAPASDGSVKPDSGARRPSKDLVKALVQRILSVLAVRVVHNKSQSKGAWDGPEVVPKQAQAQDPDNKSPSTNMTIASDTASCHNVSGAGTDQRHATSHSPDLMAAVVPNGSGRAPVSEATVGNAASGSRSPSTESPTPALRSKDVSTPDYPNIVTSLTLRTLTRGRLQASSATTGAEAAADAREASGKDNSDDVLETPATPDEIPAIIFASSHAGSHPPSHSKVAPKLKRPPSMARPSRLERPPSHGPKVVAKQAQAQDPDSNTLSPNTTDTASRHNVGGAGPDRRRDEDHSPDRAAAVVPNGSGGAPVSEATVGNAAPGSRFPSTKYPTPTLRSKDVSTPDCPNVVTSLTLRNLTGGRLQASSATAGAERAANAREASGNDSGDDVLETPATPDEIPAIVPASSHAGSRPPSHSKLAPKLERLSSIASLNGLRDGTRDLRTSGRSFGSRVFISGGSMDSSSLLSNCSQKSQDSKNSSDYQSCPAQIGSAVHAGIERASIRPRMFNTMLSICERWGGAQDFDDGGSSRDKDENILFDRHA